MPFEVSDESSYLSAVVDQFRREAGQFTGYDLKRRLWHSCVVVCEVTPERFKDWHLKLADVAFNAGLTEREVIVTIMSARRKAGIK